jgi:hypothetical protein
MGRHIANKLKGNQFCQSIKRYRLKTKAHHFKKKVGDIFQKEKLGKTQLGEIIE